jgi:hypothetical protein
MTGRHKFSELEARMSPQRRARIGSLADRLGKKIDKAEARTEITLVQQVLRLLLEHPAGLTPSQIRQKLGLRPGRSAEQSILDALNALTKSNRVSPKDRKYVSA